MIDKLQVVVDMLREHGFDTEARWIEQREHVAYYLSTHPYQDDHCQECFADGADAHMRDCKVVAAWRALGDPRALREIEFAHGEALREDRFRQRRTTDPNYRTPTSAELNGALKAAFSDPHFTSAIYADNPLFSILRKE